MVDEISRAEKIKILKKYLGKIPVRYDSRKSAILKDNIDINQWQINMNFLTCWHRNPSPIERQALEEWKAHKKQEDEEFDYREFLESNVTPELIHIPEVDLAPVLRANEDRNWFLAAYPDVFDFFYPHENLNAEDLDREFELAEEKREKSLAYHDKLIQHVRALGESNQMVYLIRMKDYYRKILNRSFLLSL